MALARWTHPRDWQRDTAGSPGRRTTFVVLGLLALLLADVAILEVGRGRASKIGANRTLSPQDTSPAPPAFVPASAVKVKRTARAIVVPQRKARRHAHRVRQRRHRSHVATGKPTAPRQEAKPVVDVDCKVVEPPMP